MSTCRLGHSPAFCRAKKRAINAVNTIICTEESWDAASNTEILQHFLQFQGKHSNSCQILLNSIIKLSEPNYFTN